VTSLETVGIIVSSRLGLMMTDLTMR